MCVDKVTILYAGRNIIVTNYAFGRRLEVTIDGNSLIDNSEVSDWLDVKETKTNNLEITLIAAQIQVLYI